MPQLSHTFDLSLLYSAITPAPAAPAPGDRYVITLRAGLNDSPCHHNMHCTATSANNFLRAVGGNYVANFSSSVSRISQEI